MVERDELITPDTVLAAEKSWKMMIQPRKMVANGTLTIQNRELTIKTGGRKWWFQGK
jgi:hypothetical protein